MGKIIKRQKSTEGGVKRVSTTITSPLNSKKSVVYTKEKEKNTRGGRGGDVTMKHKFNVENGEIKSFKAKISERGKNKYGNKVMLKSKEKGSLNNDGLYSVNTKSKTRDSISGDVNRSKGKSVVKRERNIDNSLRSLRYK